MNIFKKSAKFIVGYLLLKWIFIGVIGWQVVQTDWFKAYYASSFTPWHLLLIPATILPIILLIYFIKTRSSQMKADI